MTKSMSRREYDQLQRSENKNKPALSEEITKDFSIFSFGGSFGDGDVFDSLDSVLVSIVDEGFKPVVASIDDVLDGELFPQCTINLYCEHGLIAESRTYDLLKDGRLELTDVAFGGYDSCPICGL